MCCLLTAFATNGIWLCFRHLGSHFSKHVWTYVHALIMKLSCLLQAGGRPELGFQDPGTCTLGCTTARGMQPWCMTGRWCACVAPVHPPTSACLTTRQIWLHTTRWSRWACGYTRKVWSCGRGLHMHFSSSIHQPGAQKSSVCSLWCAVPVQVCQLGLQGELGTVCMLIPPECLHAECSASTWQCPQWNTGRVLQLAVVQQLRTANPHCCWIARPWSCTAPAVIAHSGMTLGNNRQVPVHNPSCQNCFIYIRHVGLQTASVQLAQSAIKRSTSRISRSRADCCHRLACETKRSHYRQMTPYNVGLSNCCTDSRHYEIPSMGAAPLLEGPSGWGLDVAKPKVRYLIIL